MKKYFCLIWMLLVVLLAACGPQTAENPPEAEGPLRLERLAVEVSRADLSAEDLSRAVRELPEALKTALADRGVEAEDVTVSVGSSPAATAQAVSEGGVDLGFLPAEGFAALEKAPRLLLTAGDGGAEAGAMAAVVRPEDEVLSGEAFAEALAAAVNELREDQPVFGPYDYAQAEPESAG